MQRIGSAGSLVQVDQPNINTNKSDTRESTNIAIEIGFDFVIIIGQFMSIIATRI